MRIKSIYSSKMESRVGIEVRLIFNVNRSEAWKEIMTGLLEREVAIGAKS